MNTMRKLLTAALFITVLAGFAAASTADMTIFPKESSTKINSFTSYEVNIENVGTTKDVYDLSSSNPAEITIAPRQVELEPDQEETVNLWYNPNTNKEAGRYSFSVTATSQATGNDYSVDGIVNVIKEHRVAVEVDQVSKTGCLGEQVTYTVEVTNNGLQKEEFSLSTDFGQLSQTDLVLEDGETRTIKLTASADEPMTKSFNLVAASKTSYAQDIQNVEFNSEICYASEVSITPQQKDVAAFTEGEYTVTVRNTGTKADTFTLSSNIGEFEDSELQIDGKSSKKTTLAVSPRELGQQTIEVKADSQVTSSGTTSMNVYNGMDVSVSLGTNSATVCEDESETVDLTVKNTGEVEETYKVSTDRGTLKGNEVTLEPGESATTELKLNSENFEIGSHKVEVLAVAQTFGEPVKSATLNYNVENCWDLEMSAVPEVASAGENRSTIYEIHLNNTGTKENTYQLSHEGPKWISVKPEEVTVGAGESETAYMYAGIPFQKKGEVNITAVAEGNQVKRTEKVKLVIGKDIEEAIESEEDRGNGITGAFSNAVSGAVSSLESTTDLGKVAISVVIGLIITAGVLFYEW